MEAAQMMVDIDGDVLVFLELAQVGRGGTGPWGGLGWGEVLRGPSVPGGDAVLTEGTTGSGLGCL